MLKRGTFAILMALIMVAALAAPVTTNSTTVAQEGEPLRIGVLTDHSGPLSIYGFEQTQGLMLGLEYATDGTMEVAGRPIELLIRDNASDIDEANTQLIELIEIEGVELLQGTVSSTVTAALQGAAAEYNIVLMAGPSAAPFITGENFNEFTFRVCRNSFQDAAAVAAYAEDAYGMEYMQAGPDNVFGQSGEAAYDEILQLEGYERVREPLFVAPDTTDFTAMIETIRESGADFVVISWAGASGITMMEQIADLNLNADVNYIYTANSNDIASIEVKALGEGITGFAIYHYTLPDTEINDWFVERHLEEYEEYPDLFSECAFASGQALVAALEETEGSTNPDDLIPALEGLEFEGPKGTYTIRPEDHQALQPMYIIEIVDVNADEDFAYYELLEVISAEESAPPCKAPAERSSEDLECSGGGEE
jgi:branched-chain amino acid transport system substrate-binding protein